MFEGNRFGRALWVFNGAEPEMTARVGSVFITIDVGPGRAVCIEDELVHLDAANVDETTFD